ncbi:MAG: MFS transporter [Gammaproteobacteria bacterium]|nr:MFS transporter [Gammaproteobacteria bacterium]MBT3858365.1 MFS transporter [Gammaproteobacteria bacterium]MBT3986275.1 MFS transporter [Gammaproteobacteria bacterium]MBT4254730.1 MFS transporter [Gammaproteobacteria bacterium]MBT4582217.1 MFS transporter [Gammaproteobacteria bacterium]
MEVTENRSDETIQDKVPVTLAGKLSFGVGTVGEAIFGGLFGGFIMIFYNQAIGLSNTLIGTAVMLALIGDAISDPVIGIMSDRWRSKYGRRHPFIIAAPIPMVLSIYCIFNPPESLIAGAEGPTQMGLFAWLCVWTILSRIFLTLYHVPHLALGGEMSKDQHTRSQLFSFNTFFSFGTLAIFSFAAFRVFFAGERVRESDGELVPGHLDAAAYDPLIFTAAVIILFAIWASVAGTWRYIPNLSAPSPNAQRLSPITLIKFILRTLNNRNYLVIVIGYFFFMLTSGIFDTVELFIFTYYWELIPEQIGWMRLVGAPSAMGGALLAPILMQKFDRKPVMMYSIVGAVLFAQLAVDLRLLGFMVGNDSPALLPILLIMRAGFAGSLGVITVVTLSMIGDIIDENELRTGGREEGLYYSARAFFAKASNSFGIFFAGILLDTYIRMPTGAIPGELESDILLRLGIVAGPVMAMAAVVAVFIYSKYDLNRARHQEIIGLLKDKRQSDE